MLIGKGVIQIKLSTLKNFFRDSFNNIKRNSLMSLASVASVVCALIIIGIFFIIAANVNYITNEIEDSLEIKVYLEDDITQTKKDAVEAALKANPLCSNVSYESKDQALDNFKESFGEKSYLLSGYEGSVNPLPESFILTLTDTSKIKQLYNYAERLDGVKEVVYGESVVQNLLKINRYISVISIAIFAILSCVSIFIIYNTIKLTVFARRNDITVMKYIGATDWYIRFPFIIEGSTMGVIGSIVSVLIIRNLYYYFLGIINGSVITLPVGSSLAPAGMVLGHLTIYFIIYGIIIGAVGSSFSLKKFLDV